MLMRRLSTVVSGYGGKVVADSRQSELRLGHKAGVKPAGGSGATCGARRSRFIAHRIADQSITSVSNSVCRVCL